MDGEELVLALRSHIESMAGYQHDEGGKWYMKVPDALFPEHIELTPWDKLHQAREAQRFFEAVRNMQLRSDI